MATHKFIFLLASVAAVIALAGCANSPQLRIPRATAQASPTSHRTAQAVAMVQADDWELGAWIVTFVVVGILLVIGLALALSNANYETRINQAMAQWSDEREGDR